MDAFGAIVHRIPAVKGVFPKSATPLPMAGWTVMVKDTLEVRGAPVTVGGAVEGYVPSTDADVVARVRAAGAVISGMTNAPYGGLDVQTFNDKHGTTVHPENPELSPGGSSGGSAVAVATGQCRLALGSDLAGSLRIPAHLTGLYSWKPTGGLVSPDGHFPFFRALQDSSNEASMKRYERHLHHEGQELTVGALTRTAGDLVHFAQAVLSRSQIPTWSTAARPKGAPLRVALCPDWAPQLPHIDKAIPETMRRWARQMGREKAGEVEVCEVAWPAEMKLGEIMRAHKLCSALAALDPLPFREEELQNGLDVKRRMTEAFDRTVFAAGFDVFAAPVCSVVALPHNPSHAPVNIDGVDVPYWRALISHSVPFSLGGYPVVTIPLGRTNDARKLPVGMQIVGPKGSDWELLHLVLHQLSSIHL